MWREVRDYAALTRRALRPHHDPLRRRTDRLEGLLALGFVLLLVVTVPLAIWLGTGTGARQTALAEQQARDYRQITATTVADASTQTVASDAIPVSVDTAPARWTLDGQAHTGQVSVDADTPAGAPVTVWVDAAGNLANAPISDTAATTAGIMVGLFTWVSTALLGASAFLGTRALLNRRRQQQWSAEIRAFLGSATSH